MPTWPQFEAIQVTDITTHHRDGKSTVLVRTNMHTGTHIDAPIHYWPTGKHLGEIPLSELYGSALVVDLRPITKPWSYYSLKDVLGCLPKGEEIRQGDIVILYTGWDRYNWTKPTRDDVTYFDRHPGPMPEVCDYLIDRKIKWFGGDLASMDHSLYVRVRYFRPDLVKEYEEQTGKPIDESLPMKDFEHVHSHMAKANVPMLENLGGELSEVAGRRVAGTSHSGCGYCRMCRTGRYNLCLNYGREELGHRQYGHYTQGAYAEYVIQTIKSVFRIPDGMPYDVAALCDTASIALHSVKRPGIEPGDVFVAVGSGGMGLLTAICAKTLGAARVIVVGGGKRLDRAQALGFETVDYHDGDAVATVRERTGGLGADVAVDSAGTKDSVRQSIQMVRKGGRVAFTGIPKEPATIDFQKIVLEEIDLYGVRANRSTMEEVIPLIADGRIPAAKLITHPFTLSQFGQALRTFNERGDGALQVSGA